MRSYLNTKKKKINKNTTSSSKQLSYETFLHKTNNLRPLWNRLVVETSRPNRPKKKSVRACAMEWGARCPFELVCARCACLSAQLTPRISHCEGDRASRVVATRRSDRPIIIQRMALWYILIYRSQSLKLVSFCFCALCIVETAPGSVLKASVWMLCFYGWTAY